MSENNIKQNMNEALSQEEKVEFLKSMFSTLEVDRKAIFTQWCHEEVEKGVGPLLGQKMQEVNDKMNNFIAKAYDQTTKGAKFIYEKTNEAFEPREDDVKKNISKDDGPSFFS
jgi:hypothetical protein